MRVATTILALTVTVCAQAAEYDRIKNADAEPQNWLTYNGTYKSQRYSELKQITRRNVKHLELKWMLQNKVFGAWQSNPIIDDGIMYITQRPNDVIAMDAKTGRVYWVYEHTPDPAYQGCCGANNRGVALLGDKLFMGTLDGKLVALDKVTGQPVWQQTVGDVKLAYSVTMAPLAIKDKVIVGTGGGEYGIRGYIVAYDA